MPSPAWPRRFRERWRGSTPRPATTRSRRSPTTAARENQVSLIRVIQQADSLMTKIQSGNGTLGMLATDSTLYRETTATVIQFRELLTDIQANPKKYLKISVF